MTCAKCLAERPAQRRRVHFLGFPGIVSGTLRHRKMDETLQGTQFSKDDMHRYK